MIEIRKIHFESTWDLRHSIMWPDKALDYVKLPNDKDGLHFGLFLNEKLISIVSAFITDKEAQFRKLATLPDEQGKGYGTELLNHLFSVLANHEVDRIWCNARTEKTSFYERMGMIKTERKYEKGGISFVVMEKNIWLKPVRDGV